MGHHKVRLVAATLAAAAAIGAGVAPSMGWLQAGGQPGNASALRAEQQGNTISVFRAGSQAPLVVQHAEPEHRPYLHPIAAPDGRGVLTENRPSHHPHQTGLFHGLARVNGRDYFHNPGAEYWRRRSATVTRAEGDEVRWETVYDLLDAAGVPVMTETQRWTLRERDGAVVLDLEWRGQAQTDVTIGQYDYGGLFLRMPWKPGTAAEVVNAARQRDARAEGQRAMWIDVGMQVEGRTDPAHIAIFDHPDNPGYPTAWRVDNQFGIGPARTRGGDRTIAKGRTDVVRYQIVAYTGPLSDVELTERWTEFSGNRSTSVLWGIAQREGRAAKFLTPEQAVKEMTLLDGFDVTAWAAEPAIMQPMAFCWDDRGRLWVAENHDYESRVDGFSGSGKSRILILEDTDRDGVADSRKVFMEGIIFPAAIAVGLGGVFIGAPPNLLFVPDRNADDKADVDDIEVRLTGWGIRDRHETLNSLHWGPDGWLYGLQGYATYSRVHKPKGKGRIFRQGEPFPDELLEGEGVEIDGGVWRYHPAKDRFEVVAHGFSNPWGIDYDAKGQLLISACVIPHLWHVIPGGIYHRQGGRHFNPYVYSDIQTIADHRHRSAHGGARVYQSDAFPPAHHGRIFMANIHEHAVLSDVLVRKGSGFTAHHADDFLLANNAQWIGFSVEIGPDGAVYVLDWHDADICGMDVLHEETGRIFRIAPKTSLAQDWEGRYSDLGQMSDTQLVSLQTNRSDWHARRARLILQHRAMTGQLQRGTHEALRRMFDTGDSPDWRLRSMWALHVTGGWTPEGLVRALSDRDEYVRAWAVQLLNEDNAAPEAAMEMFTALAREDPSPVVRLYLASALQRMDHDARWRIASELVRHAGDASDHNLPKMIWLGVEPTVEPDPARALARAGESRIPLVARFVARRAVDADALEPLVDAIGRRPAAEVSLLEGMREGLEGRFDVAVPRGWTALAKRLQGSEPQLARLAADISQQFGDSEAARRNLALVRSTAAPAADRRRALQILAAQRRPQLVEALPSALEDPAIRLEAIRGVAAFDSEELGKLLLARYPTFSDDEKAEAIQTLASRRRYGRLLADAIKAGDLPRRDIAPYAARQLLRVVGASFTDVWGPVEGHEAEEQAYGRYRALLNDAAVSRADVRKGREVFAATCGACHKLYGQGGDLGPDLTGSNRGNLEYLLFNVLNPNGEVQDAYKMVMVTTQDGRTFGGTVAAETDRQLTLRVVGRDPVVISKSEIQSREGTEVSMMPPGLFDALTDSEVIDLVGYLRTATPPQ